MTVERFFEEFEKLAETPDSTPRLRALALDLAMRGRLLPQDPADEPSWTTLQRTRTRPTRRSPAADGAMTGAEGPYPLPASWCWVPLAAAMEKITDGTHHSPPNGPSGDFKYVTAKNIKNDGIRLNGITYVSRRVHEEIYARCDPRFGDVLYIKDGATTGIATINNLVEPFSMLSSVALLRPTGAVDNRFLLWAMRSPFFYSETRDSMKGAAITRVTLAVLGSSLIPLPPLAEQKRIVAKVDELMALCDRLETQQQEREVRRDALASASLARFSEAPTSASLGFIFHGSYNIEAAELRKVILAMAVRGALVLQNPDDEAAVTLNSALPKQLRAIAEHVGARFSPPPSLIEARDGLPAGWGIAAIRSIGITQTGTTPSKAESTFNGRYIPFIKPGDIRGDEVNYENEGLSAIGLGAGRLIPRNSVLMVSIGGSIGKAAIVDRDVSCNQQINCISPAACIEPRWILMAIRSADFQGEVASRLATGTLPIISKGKWEAIQIPIPPLAEQRRIVAKVDQLMVHIDQLETQVASSRATGEKLLEAIVAELTVGARAA